MLEEKTKQNDHCEEEFNVQVQNNHAVDLKVARANSQHFATTPLVSPRKVPVRLCSITEPIEQQSDRLGSIKFDRFLVRFRSIDYAGMILNSRFQISNSSSA